MNRRSVRLALALLALLTIGSGGYFISTQERAIAATRQADAAFEQLFDALTGELNGLRAAQQAYVAAGQGGAFWASRVDASLATIRGQIEQWRSLSTTIETRAASESARAALDSFIELDGRARDESQSGQLLMASDLIFTDGLEALSTAVRQIEIARVAEQTSRDVKLAELRKSQVYGLAGAAGLVLLIVLVLVPVKTEPEAVGVTTVDAEAPAAEPLAAIGEAAGEEPLSEAPTPPPLPTATQDAATAATLRQTAELCSNLARVTDASELPIMLERVAGLLEASGLIVWIADRPGAGLRPVLAHGYSTQALAQMPTITRDADNATAAAYRESRLEVVRTNGATNGAIVAPMITADGCVGVMSVEVKYGAECKSALQALARIIAAQLATLISSAPAETVAEAPRELSRTAL